MLTDDEAEELRLQRDRGEQKQRLRVQAELRWRGLSTWTGPYADTFMITDAGRRALAASETKRGGL